MRQVPQMTFLIIGNGRTARHMAHYLSSLGHTIIQWHYKTNTKAELNQWAAQSNRVLLLIRDSALDAFLIENSFLRIPTTIHFSGALSISGIQNVHPLISFGLELFDLNFYSQIPFAVFEETSKNLADLLPGLNNPVLFIPPHSKPLYHGLCVASGNLMVLLWQMVGEQFQTQFSAKPELLVPYLESITHNLKSHWSQALTGPIARRDESTLLKNYLALETTPLKEIFEAHIRVAWPEFADQHFKRI